MGERKSILVGRMTARIRSSLCGMPVSSLLRRLGLPVSLRRRLVLRERRTGANVSRRRAKQAIVTAPDCWCQYNAWRRREDGLKAYNDGQQPEYPMSYSQYFIILRSTALKYACVLTIANPSLRPKTRHIRDQ